MAGGAGSWRGTGGMATKLSAARIATAAGVDMVIANGADPMLLYDIVAGRRRDPVFGPQKEGGTDMTTLEILQQAQLARPRRWHWPGPTPRTPRWKRWRWRWWRPRRRFWPPTAATWTPPAARPAR